MKPKLELPKFDGETKQSVEWINKAKEFFSIHNIKSDEEMIKYASMQLEVQAYNQYMWWKGTTQESTLHWNTFKHIFFKRFEDLKEKDFFVRVTRLQQNGDIDECMDEWEALVTHVPQLTDSQHLQICVQTKTLYQGQIRATKCLNPG